MQEEAEPHDQPCPFQLEEATLLAQSVLDEMVGRLNKCIDEKELLCHLPAYLYCETMLPIHAMFQAETLLASQSISIDQEPESAVPRIAMDSIAPKELKRERRADSSKDVSVSSPKSNQSKVKKRFSRVSSNNNIEVASPRLKLKVRPQIIPLPEDALKPPPSQEPDEAVLRRQKQYDESERKRQAQQDIVRQKRLLEAREKVQSTYANGYTFDLDGSVLRSEMVDTDKMNVHIIRLNLKQMDRLKVRDRSQITQQSIELKTSRKRDLYNTIDATALTPAPKPIEQPEKQRSNNSKYSRMRREEYSQIYGNRYSPWVSRPVSKGVSLDHDTSQQSIELLAGQRKSRIVSGVDRSLIQRPGSTILENKFTLPKLKGRYSLLDKYVTVDASGTITNFN